MFDSNSVIDVLLVDDHAVVRAGFRRLLESAPALHVKAEAGTGEAAYQLYAQGRFDVVITDISLPGISGIELARRILLRDSEARILVCSIHEEAAFVEQALASGILGYVSKSDPPDRLIEAAQKVARGVRYLSPELEQRRCAGRMLYGNSRLDGLSGREFEIFRLLAEGCTVSQIADTLSLSVKTVANYNTVIRKKLGVATGAELARIAVRCGVLDETAAADYFEQP